jgi:hypothetical protein
MRKDIIIGGLAVSLLALTVAGAAAQTPPSALSVVPGITFEGQVGGMDVWSVPGQADLFVVAPDGRTILRGLMFSGTGRDIGSAFTGASPSELFTLSGLEKLEDHDHPHPHPDEGIPVVNTATGESFAALLGPDSCQSPIINEAAAFGAPLVAGWDEAGRGNPPPAEPSPTGSPAASVPVNSTGLIDGAEVAREAQNALEGFSQDEKRDLLLELVNELRSAETQEGFLAGIAAWRARIDQMRVSKGMSRLYSEDGSAPLPPVASLATATTLAPPEIVTTPLPPLEVTLESDEIPLEQQLLEDARNNALWFSVGANDVPSVYAFIDPTCPYSASAVATLSEKIGAGALQLRVILAPVVSDRASGLIAGILNSPQPPLTFFDHEVSLAERGRSDLVPGALSDLPGPIQAGIQRNFDMIRDYGIPGVPFFVYETAEGARVLSGSPEGISFPGAMADPYTGTK